MNQNISIHWFRQDLRLADNPALYQAAKQDRVLPIYILDDKSAGEHRMGGASRWWLHHSLSALSDSLRGKLSVYSGDPEQILLNLVKQHGAKAIYWNRCYEPWRITRDKHIKETLQAHHVETHRFNGSLLWEPWDTLKDNGSPYRVFTPFFRKGCLKSRSPREPFTKPEKLDLFDDTSNKLSTDDLGLLPGIRWDKKLKPYWQVGEASAAARLNTFLEHGLESYKEGRNYPARQHVSRLSPYLHWGELSPNQVWYAAQERGHGNDLEHFLSELGWREFSYSLLYHFPYLPYKNLQAKFDTFPWHNDEQALKWRQQGQTGYPIVDAGMRALWQTGYMHNRVRMLVGSFLVKNLLLHWHHGEKWFWDCLVDADLANNSASWQWIAGCGADAAPYFRIFNPISQGHRFDLSGEYTRHYVPELKSLPDKYLFSPWEAPQDVLQQAAVRLGETYPYPIVDLKSSRERALKAFASLRNVRD